MVVAAVVSFELNWKTMSLPAFSANPTTTQQLPPPPPPQHFLSSPTSTSPTNSHHRKSTQCIKINIALEPTTASWTSSIAHHCKNGHLSKATSEFTRMRLCGVEPNDITFVTLFSGCARFPSQQARTLGPSLHGYARKLGMDTHNVMVGTTVVDMYSKFGELGRARLSFDYMGAKNKGRMELEGLDLELWLGMVVGIGSGGRDGAMTQ
ncbi:unnamed protein product [Fraxinus pennsylvanica]|uniref:Pentatricopeptide repeat-containing protein n=1 Tax=Fraxinus pennsylvanica TaxID=56036 RepID=A0AAD2A1T4_9LAMI|nr:unnamed protein product [Fraxinus pennsylvanica]